jgi:hypothetical protein
MSLLVQIKAALGGILKDEKLKRTREALHL